MARTHGHGNPNWTKDEIILALDLYLDCNGIIPSKNNKRVIELSKLLRDFPYHLEAARKDSFRNPDGVLFKLQNIRQVATGKGFGNVSNTDRRVWSELGSSPDNVKRLANLIRSNIKIAQSSEEQDEEDKDDEFIEGRLLTEIHKRKERNPKIRKSLIKSRIANGKLICDICGNCSMTKNVALEDATFEAHHLIPISITNEHKTKLKNVALLCANCHRLLHRAISIEKRWLSIEEARQIIGIARI